MRERVVRVVHLGEDRLRAAEPPGDPELLEVPDVREVPDERRHEGRDLPGQLLVGERREQSSRPGPRGLELDDYALPHMCREFGGFGHGVGKSSGRPGGSAPRSPAKTEQADWAR